MNEFVLRLGLIPGAGSRIIYRLLEKFKNIEDLFKIDPGTLVREFNLSPRLAQQIQESKFNRFFENELEIMEKSHIRYVTCVCPEYPDLLKQIPDPPPVLFYQGDLKILNSFPISFVGSRKISFYGNKVTQNLIRNLAKINLQASVISGMALGVDSIAHQAALENRLSTCAILGSGLNVIYPKNNLPLAKQILESGGLILSEYPAQTKPLPAHFPMRNRIISGLSKAVIIIEAGQKSGALITARYALEQNRDVYAIPGPIDMLNCFGTNRLIQKGEAKLLIDAHDLIDDFSFKIQDEDRPVNQDKQQCLAFEDKMRSRPVFEKILDLIRAEEMSPDEISLRLAIPISKLLSILSEMEIQGKISCTNTGNYGAR